MRRPWRLGPASGTWCARSRTPRAQGKDSLTAALALLAIDAKGQPLARSVELCGRSVDFEGLRAVVEDPNALERHLQCARRGGAGSSAVVRWARPRTAGSCPATRTNDLALTRGDGALHTARRGCGAGPRRAHQVVDGLAQAPEPLNGSDRGGCDGAGSASLTSRRGPEPAPPHWRARRRGPCPARSRRRPPLIRVGRRLSRAVRPVADGCHQGPDAARGCVKAGTRSRS